MFLVVSVCVFYKFLYRGGRTTGGGRTSQLRTRTEPEDLMVGELELGMTETSDKHLVSRSLMAPGKQGPADIQISIPKL